MHTQSQNHIQPSLFQEHPISTKSRTTELQTENSSSAESRPRSTSIVTQAEAEPGIARDTNAQQQDLQTASQDGERRANIRLSRPQFERLGRDSQTLGISIPDLLRRAYFKRAPLRPMFDREGTRNINVTLTKILNRLNQLAAKLNDGFREGFFNELGLALDDLRAMKNYLGGYYGHR